MTTEGFYCNHCPDPQLHFHPEFGRRVVMVDIDSTLSDTSQRTSLIPTDGDWKFYESACVSDALVQSTATLLELLYDTCQVFVVSAGRSSRVANLTLQWLRSNGVKYDALKLRSESVHTLTPKSMFANQLTSLGMDVVLAVDDWRKEADAYEEVGVPALLVTPRYRGSVFLPKLEVI